MILLYIRLAFFGIAITGAAIGGWYVEHLRFVAFKTDVEAQGKIQEEHNKVVLAQQKEITTKVTDNYEKKLNSLHAYYDGMHKPSSSGSAVSDTSNTFRLPNGSTKDYLSITRDCADETEHVISLQEFINLQLVVK